MSFKLSLSSSTLEFLVRRGGVRRSTSLRGFSSSSFAVVLCGCRVMVFGFGVVASFSRDSTEFEAFFGDGGDDG